MFLSELNNVAVKRLRRLYRALKADVGGNLSTQRDLLCRRAVFICCQLETLEASALSGQPFENGKYVQAVNTLLAILRSLGLESEKVVDERSLSKYLKKQAKEV